MFQMEVELRFKMLPSNARNDENIKVFSPQEEIADLEENIHRNKKRSKALMDDLEKTKTTMKNQFNGLNDWAKPNWHKEFPEISHDIPETPSI